jgi:arylsulfatase A-like enzyme
MSWTRLRPESTYQFEDDGLGEGQPNGWARTFPHVLTSRSGRPDAEFLAAWQDSPAADAYLTRIAVAAIDNLQLGQDASRRDVLAISYSVLDHVGHAYGPRSHEVQDILARLDLTLGDLLDALDKKVGRDRYVLALTGDHGVAPIPEQMTALGFDAVRISLPDLRARIDKAAEPYLGPGPHVASIAYSDIYFLPGRYEKLLANATALRAVTEAILDTPGVARVYRGDLIAAGVIPEDGVAAAVAAGYYRGRSGDLLMVPRAYSITSAAVTTHGTLYQYDARVPLLFFGAHVKPGRYAVASSPADIAPTFAFLAGITLPRPVGHVRVEAFAPSAAGAPSRGLSPGTR